MNTKGDTYREWERMRQDESRNEIAERARAPASDVNEKLNKRQTRVQWASDGTRRRNQMKAGRGRGGRSDTDEGRRKSQKDVHTLKQRNWRVGKNTSVQFEINRNMWCLHFWVYCSPLVSCSLSLARSWSSFVSFPLYPSRSLVASVRFITFTDMWMDAVCVACFYYKQPHFWGIKRKETQAKQLLNINGSAQHTNATQKRSTHTAHI